MKFKTTLLATAAVAFLIGSVPVQAATLPDGLCSASFGRSECGVLTIKGGKPTDYEYGTCQGNEVTDVTFTPRKVGQKGSMVSIDQARLEITQVRGNSFKGIWTLGNNTFPVTFYCRSE